MKIKFYRQWLVFILLISTSAAGQGLKSFTADPVTFLSEMKSFLVETDKKEGEKIMEEFSLLWNGSQFSQEQQQAIYKTSNTMLKKRMKAFPDFKNYLSALMSFKTSNQSAQSFTAWQASQDKILEKPAKHFANYIITCNNCSKFTS